jgi:6-phosphogluconolactonase (cycloisomerase 2 family)
MSTAYIGTIDGDGLLVADVQDSGELTVLRAVPSVREPSFLHVAGPTLYAVNELPDGAVTAVDISDPLRPAVWHTRPTGGVQPTHLTVHAGHLVVAHYADGTLSAHPLAADGSIGDRTTCLRHDGDHPHAHQVLPDPTGRWLVAVDLGADAVLTHRLDGGRLLPHARLDLPAGQGPRHLAFHPDGSTAHILSELRPELTTAVWDAVTGTFTVVTGVALPPGNHPAEIALSPVHDTAYLTLRGDDQVAVVDLTTHKIIQTVPTGGEWPRHCALHGDWLYVANQRSHTVTRLPVDPATGALGHPLPAATARGAAVIAFR